MEKEIEPSVRSSRRIVFDSLDLKFMSDYKQDTGIDLQTFVEKATKDKIQEIRVQQYLNEK